MPDSISECWPQRGQWFHFFHTITLVRTFLTDNLAIVVTPLFWRGAGGEATLRFAELVIGSIKALRHPLKTQSKKIIHAIIKDIFNQ